MLHKQAAYRHLIYNRFILLSTQSYIILFCSMFFICSGFEFIANKLIWYEQAKSNTELKENTKSFLIWLVDTSFIKLLLIAILTLVFDKIINSNFNGYYKSLKQICFNSKDNLYS